MPEASIGPSADSARFVAKVNTSISEHWGAQRASMAYMGTEIAPIFDALEQLSTGGKRMRALLAYWGWRGAQGGLSERANPIEQDPVTLGVALELFHAAALIHDDIIDHSDTRRGKPSVHKRFENLHDTEGWHLDAARFGLAAGILTGDLCLASSEERFATLALTNPHFDSARVQFNAMRSEVMAGQYLDVLEEAVGPGFEPEYAVERAMKVLRYKSAKYSAVHPLVLGGILGGAHATLLTGYEAFALPLGEAFQLRDDILGVFGDPAETGKPAGDDLREGKRTVLIAHTLATATPEQREFLGSALGRGDLSEVEIDQLRELIESTGALGATEDLITRLAAQTAEALGQLSIDEHTRTSLAALASQAMTRVA